MDWLVVQLDYLNALGILGGLLWALLLLRQRKGAPWPGQARALFLFGLLFMVVQTAYLIDLWLPGLVALGNITSGIFGFLAMVFFSPLPFGEYRKGIKIFFLSLWPLAGLAATSLPEWTGAALFLTASGLHFLRVNAETFGTENRPCELRLCFFSLPLAVSSLLRVFFGYHHWLPTILDITLLSLGLGMAWIIIVRGRPMPADAVFKDRFLAGSYTLPIFVSLVIIIGGMTDGLGRLSINRMEQQMLQTARLVQTVLPKDIILRLSGTILDEETEHYKELAAKMREVREAVPLLQRIYLVRRLLGRTRVFVDSEPAWSSLYTPPGTLVDNELVNLDNAFRFGAEGVLGQTGSGEWVSVLVPYRPFDHMPLVMGMDILQQDWEREIRTSKIFPLSLGFLFLVLTALFTGIGRDSWLDRRRFQESETHLRIAAESSDITLWSWPPRKDQKPLERGLPMPRTLGEWLRFIPASHRHQAVAVFREHLKGERQDFEIMYPVTGADGTTRWLFDRGKVLEKDALGRPTRMAGTRLDISERRRLTEREQESERRLMAAQKWESLGLLAGGVAHDFNNILAAVLGNIEMAEMDIREHPDRAADFLKVAAKAVSKASDLTRQMLAFAGKGQIINVALDPNELIRDQYALLRSSLRSHIHLELQLSELPRLEADPTQLQQILMNLVLNAGEALGDANGNILVRTGVRYLSVEDMSSCVAAEGAKPGLYMILSVQDDGPGMTDEVMEHLFEPFYTTKFVGRGLGLAAVHGIVRSYNGCILVKSAPGQGAEFQVGLPLTRSQA